MPQVKIVDELKVLPHSEYIFVKVDPDDEEEKTSGGIIIPRGALQNKKTHTGTVVAVGPGRRDPRDSSKLIPIDCKVGDRILFACFIGYPMVIKKEEYVIIKGSDVMAFIEEEAHYEDVEDEAEDTSDRQRIIV